MKKTTQNFKEAITNYLKDYANKDQVFKDKVIAFKDSKNIDDCITYILNTVNKSGVQGFTDDEIFGMAIHYYEEKDIDIGKDIDMKIIVNHTVPLTPEEIEEAKEKERQKIYSEQRASMTKSKKAKSVSKTNLDDTKDSSFAEQKTLFE